MTEMKLAWPVARTTPITQGFGGNPQVYARHVRLIHEDGVVTIYAHLERPTVKTGQAVEAGGLIGNSGNSGFSTGPHLHFEVRLPGYEENGYGGAVDSLPLLEAGQALLQMKLDLPEGDEWIVSTALNKRLQPRFDDTLRGCLRTGDVVTLAGSQEVNENGFCFVPVVVWVAKAYLQPLTSVSRKSDKNTKISTLFRGYPQFLASYPQFSAVSR